MGQARLGLLGKPIWVVTDGACAKKDFLEPKAALGMAVVSRLRKDAAIRALSGPRTADSTLVRRAFERLIGTVPWTEYYWPKPRLLAG